MGERLGAYELVDEIARGTHARVFRARQREPVERELAVKVLSASSPSTSLAARFARERALLARIAHPGVVPLLDAGESGERGVAWFAMPLVDGLPIDRWCSRNSAPRAIRLRLLEEAARAVAAAHALGVVHRDLKPSNILVSGGLADPRIHVIDFGVAKILGDERETGGDGTRAGAVVGTPEFMSPEQADLDAARISPASDVFALGLVGYLLLGGAVQGVALGADSDARSRAPVGQRLRIASEREIAPISQTSGDRSLRGEIEWILARACARDPARRYANAADLADDLARLREGRAIVAAPRDSGYEALHLLRRYRAGIAVAVAVVLGLVGIGFYRAEAEHRIAEAERARADAERARREQLERVLEKARVQLEPLTGRRAGSIVDNQKALELAQTLHEVNIAALGELAVESQQSAFVLANALDRSDRHEEALAVFQRLLELAEPEPDRERDRPFLRMNVGALMTKIGPTRAAEAVVVLERALGEYEALPTRNPTECGCMAYLGKALDDLGRHADARARFERAIACEERFSRQGTVTYAVQIGFLADHL
ncbi:MAG: protein kinase domain-containing protein, partial [Phycisphaerales bacterium]